MPLGQRTKADFVAKNSLAKVPGTPHQDCEKSHRHDVVRQALSRQTESLIALSRYISVGLGIIIGGIIGFLHLDLKNSTFKPRVSSLQAGSSGATSCLDRILINNANSTVPPDRRETTMVFLESSVRMSDPIKLEARQGYHHGPNLDCYVPAFNIVELTELSPE